MTPEPSQTTLNLTYTREQVAATLGITLQQFDKHERRRKLEAAGFPPKLPGCPNWSRHAVDHWIKTGGLQYPPLLETMTDDAGEAAGIATATSHLEDKYAGRAA